MKRQIVNSKDLVSIGYEGEICVLEVELQNGGIYQFHEVSHETYALLMKANVPCDFFTAHIRDKYLVQCIYPPR